ATQLGTAVASGPEPGTVWVDNAVLATLGATTGNRLEVGELHLEVTAVILHEPDRGTQFVNLAPRLLMNLADIPASGLLGPGSRVRHHLLVAGEPGVVKADRKSTRLNSSHVKISYAVFCLKKKNTTII